MNLVVIKNSTIVFSLHYRKKNQLPTVVGFLDIISNKDKCLNIPIRQEGMFTLASKKKDPLYEDFLVPKGPAAIRVADGGVLELCRNDELQLITVPLYKGSFYCRSDSYSGESAATAANHLYLDPVKIYTETYKASGVNICPFYSGHTEDISFGLKKLHDIEIDIVKLQNDKVDEKSEPFQLKISEYRKMAADFPKLFHLTEHLR